MGVIEIGVSVYVSVCVSMSEFSVPVCKIMVLRMGETKVSVSVCK